MLCSRTRRSQKGYPCPLLYLLLPALATTWGWMQDSNLIHTSVHKGRLRVYKAVCHTLLLTSCEPRSELLHTAAIIRQQIHSVCIIA